MTIRNQQAIHCHCNVTDVMVSGMGLLTIRPENAICMVGMAIKQETVNLLYQGQEGRTRTVTPGHGIRSVLDV